MSGMTASLAGLEKALQADDWLEIELAIRRILLLYSVIFSYGGIPLIYMGDELGLLNDPGYVKDPHKANDNRWLHRPSMSWSLAEQRRDPRTITGRVFQAMHRLVVARKHTHQLHGAAHVEALWTDNPHVFAYLREHPASGRLVALANFSEHAQTVGTNLLSQFSMPDPWRDASQPDRPVVTLENDRIMLQPYQFMWLVEAED
jgi:amylosucrase